MIEQYRTATASRGTYRHLRMAVPHVPCRALDDTLKNIYLMEYV
jgi:hypothetical protein